MIQHHLLQEDIIVRDLDLGPMKEEEDTIIVIVEMVEMLEMAEMEERAGMAGIEDVVLIAMDVSVEIEAMTHAQIRHLDIRGKEEMTPETPVETESMRRKFTHLDLLPVSHHPLCLLALLCRSLRLMKLSRSLDKFIINSPRESPSFIAFRFVVEHASHPSSSLKFVYRDSLFAARSALLSFHVRLL